MDVTAIQSLLGSLPGGGVAALAIWFALKKDSQCTTMMGQMTDLATKQGVAMAEMKATLDGILNAVRAAPRS